MFKCGKSYKLSICAESFQTVYDERERAVLKLDPSGEIENVTVSCCGLLNIYHNDGLLFTRKTSSCGSQF